MKKALQLAQKAADIGEVPVGALIVKDGEVLSEAYNLRESLNKPTAHAELLAIEAAAQKLNSWRLIDCTLYVTLEPCPMCAGTIINSRIPNVVYGAKDPKAGAVSSLYELLTDDRLNHKVDVTGGILAEECGQILSQFFKNIRSRKR